MLTFLGVPEMPFDGPGHIVPEVLKQPQHSVSVDHARLSMINVAEEIQKDVAPRLQHGRVAVGDSTLRQVLHQRVVEVWRQVEDVLFEVLKQEYVHPFISIFRYK